MHATYEVSIPYGSKVLAKATVKDTHKAKSTVTE